MSETDHSAVALGEQEEAPHEHSDVNVRAILGFCLGLIVVAAIVHGMILLLFKFFAAREGLQTTTEYPLAAGQDLQPPEPRLQTNPRGDLQELRQHEDEVLGSYNWIDKDGGVVRIPIEQAMKLTLQRGLPARSGNGTQAK